MTDEDSTSNSNEAGQIPTIDHRVDGLAGRAQGSGNFVDGEQERNRAPRRDRRLSASDSRICPAAASVTAIRAPFRGELRKRGPPTVPEPPVGRGPSFDSFAHPEHSG